MKSSRMLVGGLWRGLARNRAITLRGVKSLLTKIFNPVAPEQGTAIDYSDLTDEKLMWRRNLFNETEFRNGVTDASSRGGNITATTLPGYAGALLFAPTGGVDCYAYKASAFTALPNRVYTMSAVVQMTDGLPPVFSNASPTSPQIDFTFRMGTSIEAPIFMNQTSLGGGLYRVWMTRNVGANMSALSFFGPVKYASTSSRTFKITAMQVELGDTMSPYQALSDISTEFMAAFPNHSLFQDNLGQLAVFAPEQPIGLALDTRFGAVRGPEAWGASPSVPAGWTNNGGGSYTHAGGSSGSSIGSSFPVSAGKTYEVSFVVAGRTAGTLTPYAGATGNGPVASANGMFRVIFTAVGGTGAYLFANAAFDGTVGNISFREIVGNHAIQATVNDRPISDAKTNRLTYTEQLSNAIWTKSSGGTGVLPVATDNFGVAPDGTTTASRVQMSTGGGTTTADISRIFYPLPSVSGSFYTPSVWLKTNDGTTKIVSFRDDNALTVNQNITVTPTWQKFQFVTVAAGNSQVNAIGLWVRGGTGTDLSADLLVWHPHVERTNSASIHGPYQRVGAANDYDAIGFPKGARFNGTNSWMSMGLDLSGSSKLGVALSLRKESDAATAMVLELSPSTSANDGTFGIRAPQGAAATYGFAARGTGATSGADAGRITSASFTAPRVDVLSCKYDLAQSDVTLQVMPQVNGVAGALGTMGLSYAGGGNFGVGVLYIARRGGTSLPFNGVIYRIGIRGTQADNFIAMMERWANEPLKPTYINSLPQAAAVAPLDRVIILGASLETGAFGGAVNTQSTEIVAAQNRILAMTGKAVTIHQYAVSGQDLNGTVNTSWPKALSEQAALPGNGRTLVIIGSGGNTITNASRPLSASVLSTAKGQLLTMIDQIEAKGWDWCLFDLSWRNYSAPLNQYDRTQGAWPWITGVTRSINAARKKLWGRNWVYPDGASWGDLYALYRNNVQFLADEVHPSDYLLTRNYVIDNVMIPAITGVPVDQRFIRDEAYPLGLTTGTPTVSGTTITLPSMATHQGTLHLALYAAGSNPSAAEVVAGNGTGYLTKVAAGRNGTTIDKVVQQAVTAPANSTNYVLAAVFVSDARQTSGVVLNNVTSGVATGGGGGSGSTSPVVMLLRQDKIASPRANINQLSVTEDLTTPGLKLANAVRLDGTPSGIGYTQVNGFNQVNAAGQSANLVPGYFQAGELNQSWYVDLGTANVNLTGFTAGQSYQIMFAASRDVPSTDATRTGDVTITSGTVAGAATQTLNAANPASGLTAGNVTFTVTAPANGVIGFQFKRTAGNSGFGYIGGIHITPVA